MGKYEKIYTDVMSGQKDFNIKFADLCHLMRQIGFSEPRVKGDHYMYSYPGIAELINLQPDKHDPSKAKAYQVSDVRKFIEKYHIGGKTHEI